MLGTGAGRRETADMRDLRGGPVRNLVGDLDEDGIKSVSRVSSNSLFFSYFLFLFFFSPSISLPSSPGKLRVERAGHLTYHIDTPIPRNGDDGVEASEIDPCNAQKAMSALRASPSKRRPGNRRVETYRRHYS